MSAPAATVTPGSTTKVIALVSTAHFFSHFYLLLLPPLFPILVDVYGVGFTELGFAVAAFSVTSAIMQAPVGFLVDRYGARGILIGGVALEGIAFALIGVFPFYGVLVLLMVIAGLANAVYHPADYAILNASVPADRMGRAFSIHTTSGYLGDALAPVTVVMLMAVIGWDGALLASGCAGILMALVLLAGSGVLVDATDRPDDSKSADSASPRGLALLFSVPVLMGLLFFVGISMYGRGISGFGPSVLNVGYEIPLSMATTMIACYLFASPAGVLVGGWIADQIKRHDAFAGLCFVVIGAVVCTLAATDLPVAVMIALFLVAGFFTGMVSPSRDMLIRSLTPPGEIGKVFGFVSSGFSVGGIVAPPVFGAVLDHSEPNSVFWIAGLIAFATTVTVLFTGAQARRVKTS